MKEPDSVAKVADSVLKDAGLGKAVELWSIYAVLKDIFAKEIVESMKIVSLSNGLLKIRVPSSSWAQELSFFEEKMIEKINVSVGKNLVKQIRFTEV